MVSELRSDGDTGAAGVFCGSRCGHERAAEAAGVWGSQGARILNTNVPKVAKELLDAVPGLTILHQSGGKNLEVTQAAYAASGADLARVEVMPFIDDMPARFAEASLVMARSGASTVAELAAAGKPSLLVPFAAAADAHQKRNAEAMVAAGAAVMLEEQELARAGQAA
jgi:UDP-N-acetylglucosamine--N-acetylmuramyl-(pentapeptide) pyrophosphoryl-undecaprenol N-acetylglucosamine transferase